MLRVFQSENLQRKKWYVFIEADSTGSEEGVCADCWNKNQEQYKQNYETISEQNGEGNLVTEPLIKDKCKKCGHFTFSQGKKFYEILQHKVIGGGECCWEKDTCDVAKYNCKLHEQKQSKLSKI